MFVCVSVCVSEGTFKLKKNELRQLGYVPARAGPSSDRVFYYDLHSLTYKPLTDREHALVLQGQVRF